MFKAYLDVDEMLEEFRLTKGIRITLHGIGNLRPKVRRV